MVETAPFHDDGHTLLAVRYDNGYWIETADGYRNATNAKCPTRKTGFGRSNSGRLHRSRCPVGQGARPRIGDRPLVRPA